MNPPPNNPPTEHVESPASAFVGRYRILVVDDDPASRTQMAESLADLYDVLSADGMAAALEVLEAATPDEPIHAIVADQYMPGGTGHELLLRAAEMVPRAVRILTADRTEMSRAVAERPDDLDEVVHAINEGEIRHFMLRPVGEDELITTVQNALSVYEFEEQNKKFIEELKAANEALQEAMKNLHVTQVTSGVYWLQVPEADLFILCGCPADVTKHLMRKGYLAVTMREGVTFESGPNAILLSDTLIQQGEFSNLSEFPVLQMMYRQGMLIPNHPNNKGVKPLLIGSEAQVNAQMEYIFRGNYGLTSIEELMATGLSREEAETQYRIKLHFAFGTIEPTESLLDACVVDREQVHIRNGVYVRRTRPNAFEFEYRGKRVEIDLTLPAGEYYQAPYQLGFHPIDREYFAILHTGEGDGWDPDRPCMASIILYRGDVYLIDAGPGIQHTLRQLGIDVSEIKGIFHTHGHDDHFAGLPGLMQGDHQIKYYATPPVRAAVAKKLSALMSMEEELFYQYFEVCDLTEGEWCDIDGLEVKPIYSPHPVETNVLLFRARGDEGYRNYAHWADLTSFEVLENMVEEDAAKPGLTRALCDEIKRNYLTPVDIKKVDVGGGMIHGQVQDYAEDRSDKIILAHRSAPYTSGEKEVGSEASFATVDVLIAKDADYLLQRAARYLQEYFPGQSLEQLKPLLNCPIEMVNPGTILLERGKRPENVYLIVSGTLECIRSEANITFNQSTGSFIGDLPCLNNSLCTATYRSVSHVKVLRVSDQLYRSFLESNDLLEQVLATQNNIDLLRECWLFGEELSYLVQNKIAQAMVEIEVDAGEMLPIGGTHGLYVVDDGELVVRDSRKRAVEILNSGDFLGEDTIVSEETFNVTVEAASPSRVYFINADMIVGIPILHWKLLEVWARRKHRIEF